MSKRVVRVLLIDPNERDYLLIENLLSEIEIFKFKLDWAKTEDEEQAAIANLVCDAYIISDSEQLLARLLPKVSPAPVIVLVNSTQSGIAALSAGAADYLDKNHLSAPLLERSLRLTLTYATDIHRQVKSPEKHRLSEEDYLTTLVEIERQLLNSQNINTCCSNILELLGKASGASRVYLLEIHPDRMGNLSMKQRGEWFAQSAVSEIGKSVVAKVSRRDISTDWIEILSRGELISTTVADLPESERHYFQLLNILSILILPLTLGGKLFGLLGFDNCLEAREWQASEVAFLQAAAGAISLKLERVLAETALGEMEEKLSTIFYRAPVGIAQVALTGKLLMVNQKLCQLLGYTPGELTRLKVQDLTHPDEWGIAIPLTQRMLEEKIESFSYEKRYVRKDGCYIWVNVTVSIVRDSLGEPKYTIKVIEDIQERKEGEEALKRSEKRLRLIADSLPVCISYVDDRWRYRFVNKNYERWFGYKSEDICGKHLAEILGEEAYRLVRGKLERVLAGEQITYEAEIPFQRGGRRYIRATFVPDFDDKFQVKGFYALVADISDRKRAEQQLQYRLTLETALVEVSKEFATNETADVNRILEFLGMAVGASRAYFVRFRESGATGSMTHEWCDSQTEPDIDNFQNMDISVFSWWYEKLNNKQNIIIERVEALPSSAEVEKNYLLSLGVNSVLAVPIYNQSGQLWGQLGFDSSGDNYKHWSEEDSQLLRVVGEMILS
ncbi:MAG: PAS domain S-box protein, partial [Prochloraceae cyanobacterium]